jgi:oxalate decarboxylase/phosphoglucose isomerase-like protein (cupin superfamily)
MASDRHNHPNPEVGYIVRGDVAMGFDDRPTLTLRTGDPCMIPPGVTHNARNIGTVTTKMLSTYVVDETKLLATLFDERDLPASGRRSLFQTPFSVCLSTLNVDPRNALATPP